MRRGWRFPAMLAAVLVAAVGLSLLLLRPSSGARLDPASAAPDGSLALVHVLRDHGVDVRVRHRFADVSRDVGQASGPVGVVVARPDLLGVGRAADLRRLTQDGRSDLVVVAAGNDVLADLDLPYGSGPAAETGLLHPACGAALPTRAGTAYFDDLAYSRNDIAQTHGQTASCYPVQRLPGQPAAAAYVEIAFDDGRITTLLGSGTAMTNDRIGTDGNASLSVGALGRRAELVWWTPDPLDGAPQAEAPTINELLPDAVRYGALQLVVVLAVVIIWRARRFGRLVPEPLPVVVRAIETTRGRAQLYRRARARGRAAQVLRVAAVRRLATRTGLARTADVSAVAAAVATATGRPADQVEDLLVGPDPADDATLVRLARDLDALEKEVHRP
ncbi:DUF4350 domain-containing protein [Angustibacter sp. McL0619]|uniref:DUF4350 domain-containing protein n=1 Tax=Angustibacter sp. McL0619 TaxID=3415676 RepID=UPI003CF9C393